MRRRKVPLDIVNLKFRIRSESSFANVFPDQFASLTDGGVLASLVNSSDVRAGFKCPDTVIMYRQHVPLPACFTRLYAHALQVENVGGHTLKVDLSQAAVMSQRRNYARSNGNQTSAIAMSGELPTIEQQKDNFVCSNKMVRHALQRLRP